MTKNFIVSIISFANFRFNHVFRIQGFSAEELEQRHIILEVFGKNNQRKDLIGKVILGGLKCKQIFKLQYNCFY